MAFPGNPDLINLEKYVRSVNIVLGEHEDKLSKVASNADFINISKEIYGEGGSATDIKEGSILAKVNSHSDAIDLLNDANTVEGSVAYKIKMADDAVRADVSTLEGRVDDVEEAIELLNGDASTAGSVAASIATAIDNASTYTNNTYVTNATYNKDLYGEGGSVTDVKKGSIINRISAMEAVVIGTTDDGTVNTVAEVFNWIKSQDDGTGNIASSVAELTKLVKGQAAGEGQEAVTGLVDKVDTNTTDIAKLNGTGEGSVAKAIADASTYNNTTYVTKVAIYGENGTAENPTGGLAKAVANNKNAIDTLNGDATTEGSVAKAIADLKIGDYVTKVALYGEGGTAEAPTGGLAKTVAENKTGVAENKAAIDTLNGDATVDGSVKKAIADASTFNSTKYATLVQLYGENGTAEKPTGGLAKVVEDNEKVCAEALTDLFTKIEWLSAQVAELYPANETTGE